MGAFQSFSRAPRALEVNTPYINGLIEGTEFLMRVEADQSLITVFEGKVAASNDLGRLLLAGGESAVAKKGEAPQPQIVVRPRDAVQWALYYPPVLSALGGQAGRVPPGEPPAVKKALEAAARGDAYGAMELLERTPASDRNAQFHLYRAALLLNVGRVNEARADIDGALKQDPKAGLAYALRSIIHVVQNEREEALADAERAVQLSPTAAARIALSYAQQADFRIEAARDTLLAAVEQHPDDPLAWARLGELWLMLGERDKAREAARTAASLDPDLARTQLVLGFAALAEFRTRDARQAFERAIALASADPLGHLGLSLAEISDGKLAEGRQDLEVAVGLDANNALLRAYLGKAYFEEKRDPLDAQQYGIAKELDPNDPTAYLYDAIRKQTENRPGEALQDLQASIERNDNRAVYRSRLALDEDRAARGTSLARVYNDLGFTQLGLDEAGISLALDPSNSSAHRFLSDSYRGVRRREISRVSELLQAQMLQDVNINPVQPSLSETNLNIVTAGGPAEAGFNEFTPLFERNEARLDATGIVGSHDTEGGEGVVSALYDWLSLSAGLFHYDTEGWRPNHDIKHDIYNVFVQAAVTPDLNIQAEFRRRDTKFGDLEFDFDPDAVAESALNQLDQDIARFGLRYSPAPHSNLLFSYIHSKRKEGAQDEFFDNSTFDGDADEDADQFETQYIFEHDRFNVLAGFGYTRVEGELDFRFAVGGTPAFLSTDKPDTDDYRGYIYANISFPEAVTWTVGLSVVDFLDSVDTTTIIPGSLEETSQLETDLDKINPKFGVQWDVTKDILFRAAYFEVVKPPLVANRTLEPTQIAGFNQFFDDANATKSRRYGFGLDWQLFANVALGAETTWRDIEEPFTDATVSPPVIVLDGADERLHQAYLYWTPVNEVAIRTSFVFDQYERDSDDFSIRVQNQNPLEVETISVPVNATYFHPSGFFAAAGVTYVDQDVQRISILPNQGDDQFAVVDAGLGFRFPNRWGIASLQVRNLFDEDFNYQDDSFREFSDEPSVGPYFPERTVLARVTFSF